MSKTTGKSYSVWTAFRLRAVLVVFVIFTLLGCDQKSPENSSNRVSEVATADNSEYARPVAPKPINPLDPKYNISASKPWRIVVIMKGPEENNLYWRKIQQGFIKGAKDWGVELKIRFTPPAPEKWAAQAALVEQVIAAKPDGVILLPIDSLKMTTSAKALTDAQIPYLIMDTPLIGGQPITQLTFDNQLAAQQIAKWFAQSLGKDKRILVLDGDWAAQNAQQRQRGFRAGLNDTGVNIIAVHPANWSRKEAFKAAYHWLTTYYYVDGVIAASDQMALGALDAVELLNRQSVAIAGFDGNAEAIRAVQQGRMLATIDQRPTAQAMQGIQLLIRYLESGEKYPEQILWPPGDIITRSP
mgnify:CR=1 FL=1